MSLYDFLYASTWKLSHSLSTVISRHGVAKGIAVGEAPPDIALDDFFFYCLAKGSKHIRAAVVLIENELPEDAIVLSRAAYECYICAAYAKVQGIKAMDALVYNPVGLSAGRVEYTRNKHGKPNYWRVIDKRTGVHYDAAPSIEKMASGTGNLDDALVHRYFYGFASQHVHVDMCGSGNYRDGVAYTDEGNGQSQNAIFLLAYVTVILTGLAVSRVPLDQEEKRDIEEDIKDANVQINEILNAHGRDMTEHFVAGVKTRLDR